MQEQMKEAYLKRILNIFGVEIDPENYIHLQLEVDLKLAIIDIFHDGTQYGIKQLSKAFAEQESKNG